MYVCIYTVTQQDHILASLLSRQRYKEASDFTVRLKMQKRVDCQAFLRPLLAQSDHDAVIRFLNTAPEYARWVVTTMVEQGHISLSFSLSLSLSFFLSVFIALYLCVYVCRGIHIADILMVHIYQIHFIYIIIYAYIYIYI